MFEISYISLNLKLYLHDTHPTSRKHPRTKENDVIVKQRILIPEPLIKHFKTVMLHDTLI